MFDYIIYIDTAGIASIYRKSGEHAYKLRCLRHSERVCTSECPAFSIGKVENKTVVRIRCVTADIEFLASVKDVR